MSIKAMVWAQDLQTRNSGQKLILLLLADAHIERSDTCDPSISRMAHRAVMTERNVLRVLSQLEEDGFIRRISNPGRRTEYLLVGLSQTQLQFDAGVTERPRQNDRGDAAGIAPDDPTDPRQNVTPDNSSPVTPESGDPRHLRHPTPDTGVRGPLTPTSGATRQVLREDHRVDGVARARACDTGDRPPGDRDRHGGPPEGRTPPEQDVDLGDATWDGDGWRLRIRAQAEIPDSFVDSARTAGIPENFVRDRIPVWLIQQQDVGSRCGARGFSWRKSFVQWVISDWRTGRESGPEVHGAGHGQGDRGRAGIEAALHDIGDTSWAEP